MTDGWFERLKEAISRDGRSLRELSAAAGFGPNYVQQMLRDGKEPGADKLGKLLETLGGKSGLFVLTGLDLNDQDLEFVRILSAMDPQLRKEALKFFQALQAREEDREPHF